MFAKYIQNLYEISKKGKKSFSKKNNKKVSSNSSQVECFNYGAKGHFATNFPTLERNKKTMHVTWGNSKSINNETTSSTNSEDNNALVTLTISLISPKKIDSPIELCYKEED